MPYGHNQGYCANIMGQSDSGDNADEFAEDEEITRYGL